ASEAALEEERDSALGSEVDGEDEQLDREQGPGEGSAGSAAQGGALSESPPAHADSAKRSLGHARRSRVTISNPNKIFWPNDKLTKKDLCDYYMAVADAVLPHLRDRPVVLVRYPDGIAGKNFYQWNVPQGTPSWVKTINLARDEDGGSRVTCFLVNDADTLL